MTDLKLKNETEKEAIIKLVCDIIIECKTSKDKLKISDFSKTFGLPEREIESILNYKLSQISIDSCIDLLTKLAEIDKRYAKFSLLNYINPRLPRGEQSLKTGQICYDFLRLGTHTICRIIDGKLVKFSYNFDSSFDFQHHFRGQKGQIDIDPNADFSPENRECYKIVDVISVKDYPVFHAFVDENNTLHGCKFRLTVTIFDVKKIKYDSNLPLLSVLFDPYCCTKAGLYYYYDNRNLDQLRDITYTACDISDTIHKHINDMCLESKYKAISTIISFK